MTTTHESYCDEFMLEAFAEAKTALANGEVPVGCVFVRDGKIIARGHNKTNARKNALEHAELVAIRALEESPSSDSAAGAIAGSDLYVTVEPCIMCGAAILYRGVGRVFFGCRNPRFGGNGTVLSLHNEGGNGDLAIGYQSIARFREAEAIALLQNFYEQENPSAPEPRPKVKRRTRDDGDYDE